MNGRSLRSTLSYEPQELRFGTSGRRGEVIHLTQLEIYINACAEIAWLQSLPAAKGGVRAGDEFFFAYDLRPSSTAFVPEQGGRGEIAQAIERAIRDSGMRPVNLGPIPTPALAYHALSRRRGSMMITGSHIPFDRNGYKMYTATGELMKEDEGPVNEAVAHVRRQLYDQPFDASPFNECGQFKCGHLDLPPRDDTARAGYARRYTDFFAGRSLAGRRILVFQHSSVGRDILVEILENLGADVSAVGRSESFVPIDTENIDAAMIGTIQSFVDSAALGPPFAVVSADGDADRPLVLGVDANTGRVRFLGGDLLGILVAESLGADAVVVPISCNDAIDRSSVSHLLRPKTRIGSPYVLAEMEAARSEGRQQVCGWEPNGGFLTMSDIERGGRVLRALPTRDAMLPILSVLLQAHEQGLSLTECFDRLPPRFSRASLLRPFPRDAGLKLLSGLEVRLDLLSEKIAGAGKITALNKVDGLRMTFANGEVLHFRPSGNADEFRVYAVADSPERAQNLVDLCVAEPAGILRQLEGM